MPQFTDYYAILGVDRYCSIEEIQASVSFLSSASRDIKGATNYLEDISAASSVLNDPRAREKYNREYDRQATRSFQATVDGSEVEREVENRVRVQRERRNAVDLGRKVR
jgi:DnaJ-class molecular chaperone